MTDLPKIEEPDPNQFDIDAWIDDVERPHVVAVLHTRDHEFGTRLNELDEKMKTARNMKDTDRGLDDPTPESVMAELTALRAERERTARRVKVWQLTQAEIAAVAARAAQAGVTDPKVTGLWVLSAATADPTVPDSTPTFTPAQLQRLQRRDVTGERMVDELLAAFSKAEAGLTVPF